ncbi:MAG TPA: hypothetical protein VEX13_09165 [Chloroflexia bacterium]|nr:hypothetical protein [Chloroflexia bacterium]
MATLKLKSFRCIEETDETGSDSPYFVIFVGRPGATPSSDVVTIREVQWDNEVDTGDFSTTNSTVAGNVGTNAVVLVALMEEDDGPNVIGSGMLAHIKQVMNVWFNPLAASNLTPQQIAFQILPTFRMMLDVFNGNDEIVSVKSLRVTTLSGNLAPLSLNGDGGRYQVQFSMN